MTLEEFEQLKQRIINSGHVSGPNKYDSNRYWYCYHEVIFLKWVSTRSKYKGSILRVERIMNDKILAYSSILGAPKIRPDSHFKNYELTNECKEKYVDNTITNEAIKDFFDDDINVGDYVFGEYNRDVIFGVVRSTKKGTGKEKAYHSKKLEHDAAMIEVVKSKNRSWRHDSTGKILLMEMRYFIKVEDPTIYLLKI